MVIGSNILAGASGQGGSYTIDQSIRFNDDDSAYLTRTAGSAATSNRKFTVSMWVKRANLPGSDLTLFSTPTGTGRTQVYFDGNDKIYFGVYDGSTFASINTDMVFRDVSSWYHLVFTYDIDNGTANNRLRIYVNGIEATGSRTNPTTGVDSLWMKNATVNDIGRQNATSSAYLDAYIAEFYSIDGQALDASSFGETNSDTGQWAPIDASGSLNFGTNGFYLKGQDSSALGDDSSGNGNDFTSSGLTSADQVVDTPTDSFCTISSINYDSSQITLQDGNLRASWNTPNGDGGTLGLATFAANTQKCYWEFQAQNSSVNFAVGIANQPYLLRRPQNDSTTPFVRMRYGQYTGNGTVQVTSGYGSVDTTGVATITGSEIGMMAYDPDSGKFWVGKDGTWFNSGDPASGTNPQGTFTYTGDIFPCVMDFNSNENGDVLLNFGQSGFAHTPPTGYKALSTGSLPDPTIADPSAHFQSTLYTGDGSTQEVNQSENSTFNPGFVWIKLRSIAANHELFDQVRGVTNALWTNSTSAETTDAQKLQSFDSDGFTVGTNGNVNGSGYPFIAYQWKANGSGSSNTDGSATSTVSVNTTAGFSIVSYAGAKPTTQTIGHGLGVTPDFIIVKDRDAGGNWTIWHQSFGADEAIEFTASAKYTSSTVWNNTLPTSSVFSVGDNGNTNTNTNNIIAYCFAEVEGFSKFTTFNGNDSSNGPFIYTGFRPAYVLVKVASGSTGSWRLFDTSRNPYNAADKLIYVQLSNAEATSAEMDILSNGFKIKVGNGYDINDSGDTMIVAAFAESPFKTANAR